MLKQWIYPLGALWLCCLAGGAAAQDVTIRVDARQPGRPVSRYLAGACIEDVNHEIYSGIYSQMIFGESFQEPPTGGPLRGFVAMDGEWSLKDGQVHVDAGPGLLFLDPEKVWLQPPGYVTQMVAGSYQPLVIDAAVKGGDGRLDVTATRSGDGKSVVLRVVNLDGGDVAVRPALVHGAAV